MDTDIRDMIEKVIVTLLTHGEVAISRNTDTEVENLYIYHNNGFKYDHEYRVYDSDHIPYICETDTGVKTSVKELEDILSYGGWFIGWTFLD